MKKYKSSNQKQINREIVMDNIVVSVDIYNPRRNLLLEAPGNFMRVMAITPAYRSVEAWSELCDWASNQINIVQFVKEVNRADGNAHKSDDEKFNYAFKKKPSDCSIVGALGYKSIDVEKRLPIPLVAQGKWSDDSPIDELSMIRTLHWGGSDINELDEMGLTALHYFCSVSDETRYPPDEVAMLLEMGACPNISGDHGITPLMFLAGFEKWSSDFSEIVKLLLDYGADPCSVNFEGDTVISMMEKLQEAFFSEERSKIIELLKQAASKQTKH